MTVVENGDQFEVSRTNMVEVGDLRDPQAREKAARLTAQGKPIGLYNVAVSAILGDGSNPAFVESVSRIKGEKRGQRPLAACLTTEQFVELLDPTKISSELHDKFFNARDLASRTGSLCFFRGPITKQAAVRLPQSMVSEIDGVSVIQNWDAAGHQPTNLLLAKMRAEGVEYPAITSMNESGNPEIVDQHEAVVFSQDHGLPMFLSDEKTNPKVTGSYTILELNPSGLKLLREGNIPSAMLSILLDAPIDTEGATTAKSANPLTLPEGELDAFKTVDPKIGRIAILSALNKKPFPNISTLLENSPKRK